MANTRQIETTAPSKAKTRALAGIKYGFGCEYDVDVVFAGLVRMATITGSIDTIALGDRDLEIRSLDSSIVRHAALSVLQGGIASTLDWSEYVD